MTADDLRAAIAWFDLDVFRRDDGTYGLWDIRCCAPERPRQPQRAPSARSRVGACL
jgi:hypothetical protein